MLCRCEVPRAAGAASLKRMAKAHAAVPAVICHRLTRRGPIRARLQSVTRTPVMDAPRPAVTFALGVGFGWLRRCAHQVVMCHCVTPCAGTQIRPYEVTAAITAFTPTHTHPAARALCSIGNCAFGGLRRRTWRSCSGETG